MSDISPSHVPAGWYPDPTDASWQRWWDGVAWTAHAVPASPSTGQGQAPGRFEASAPASAAPSVPLRSDIATGTVWIWLVVLLPLVMLPAIFLIDWRGYLAAALEMSASSSVDPLGPSVGLTMSSLALSVVGYLIAGLGILFAWLDWRTLARRGVHKPFPWAWALLSLVFTNGVYVIGRGVVLRRQTGKGLAPVWAWIAVTVLSLVVGVGYALVMMTQAFELILDQSPSLLLS